MYDAPFDALTRLGWILAAAVAVVLAARAVRVELRAGGPRAPDRVLDAAAVLAVAALVAVLVAVVVAGLA